MRAALEHLARNPDAWLAGVVARGLRAAARVLRDAAGLRGVGRMLRGPPVGGPFPDIADHVVEAVAVGRKGRDRRRPFEPVLSQILVREFTLPGIGHLLAAGSELVAPGEFGAVEAAARREF